MSPVEYLAWEREQVGRYQYLAGAVFAMAGGSPRHNLLAANVLAALHGALRGGPCRVFTSDQKIHVGATGDYVYADATVVCGAIRLHEPTRDVLENPTLIVEVLSRSTEQHDRGDKWRGYRELPSLTDYVLVSQWAECIEHYAREPDGSWRYRVFGANGNVALACGGSLEVDRVYEGALDVEGD